MLNTNQGQEMSVTISANDYFHKHITKAKTATTKKKVINRDHYVYIPYTQGTTDRTIRQFKKMRCTPFINCSTE
jgi:hypothetical protein